jgi:hypothetical protein
VGNQSHNKYGEKPPLDAPEHGLRILARMIVTNLVRGEGSQEKNDQPSASETEVSGEEENHSIAQWHHRSCDEESSNEASTEKLSDKEERR